MSVLKPGIPPDAGALHELRALIDAVRTERSLDPRTTVFEVELRPETVGFALTGQTTDPDALAELVRRLDASAVAPLHDRVVRLPAPAMARLRAVVRSALAPVHGEPRISSAQVSQYVLGDRIEPLGERDAWRRVRGPDGYIGWVHTGYLAMGDEAWASAWAPERDADGVVSLGADLVDPAGEPLTRLPWGARAIREGADRLRLPDGRVGRVAAGSVVPSDQCVQRFPPRGPGLARTALGWLGTPYQWGGVTPAGADCSGFVQAVYRLHGITLPRDSDQQAAAGAAVECGGDYSGCRPGDLLFFAERPGRVTHVALSLGGGRIVHSALSNGGVAIDDLNDEGELARKLASTFVTARRIVPD